MTNSLFDLSGWIALNTGSTQGLGEATARDLAEHDALVIISSQKKGLQQNHGRVSELWSQR